MGLLLTIAVGSVLMASLFVLPLLLFSSARQEQEVTANVEIEEEDVPGNEQRVMSHKKSEASLKQASVKSFDVF